MRTPVTLKIKFKSSNLDQFIERYSVDVSRGGIFIRTKEPLAVGTQLKFEFQLQDASSLISGEGTVVWIREHDPARPGGAPGMGVKFDRRGAASQQVRDRILHEKGKGEPTGRATQEQLSQQLARAEAKADAKPKVETRSESTVEVAGNNGKIDEPKPAEVKAAEEPKPAETSKPVEAAPPRMTDSVP